MGIQNWCPELTFGTGNLAGDPFMAYVPNGGAIIQAFYRGSDNALWTRWGGPYDLTAWPLQSLSGGLGGDPFVITLAEL